MRQGDTESFAAIVPDELSSVRGIDMPRLLVDVFSTAGKTAGCWFHCEQATPPEPRGLHTAPYITGHFVDEKQGQKDSLIVRDGEQYYKIIVNTALEQAIIMAVSLVIVWLFTDVLQLLSLMLYASAFSRSSSCSFEHTASSDLLDSITTIKPSDDEVDSDETDSIELLNGIQDENVREAFRVR